MALITRLGESSCHVVWVCRPLIILEMATHARGAREIEIVVDVAIGALPRRHCVPPSQRKSNRRVIEVRTQPVICAVASFASEGKLRGHVIGIAGGLEVRRMARIAGGGHGLKLTVGPALMAGIAIHRGMRAGEWEAVIVLLDLLHRDLPAPDGMALLAICSQLPPVNVCMAVLAALADIRENRLDVALGAAHRRMHSSQRIPRLIVIEFRVRAGGLPRSRSMAILTGEVEISVWTMRSRGILRLCSSGKKRQH